MATKIISYNVNGIRAAISKGLWSWVEEEQPDVFCVQETKASKAQVSLEGLPSGYESVWYAAEKKGYSGVAVFSRLPIVSYSEGIGDERLDAEGRVLKVEFESFTLINAYFPSGTSGSHRQEEKERFLELFSSYLQQALEEEARLIICGDFNIAHLEMDLHDPKRNRKTPGFLPHERAWLDELAKKGWVDTFRKFDMTPENYTWWSYMSKARDRNKGWRLDYIWSSKALDSIITRGEVLSNVNHSDHCPVLMMLDTQS
ncbi:exodeoxyribonuclease III [Pontibacter sp. G13]|uniref:exodeoxyribonuclease III n=1 Tax=Pontibacter sp. G13 TaxID=3074898 RepID=UPI00288A1468|nr:exodeoxyribonuclease III [Pontibacter sp. G13]WNJ15915.1 exodeoxyribonuclease III [Pontibacter sp. G13]